VIGYSQMFLKVKDCQKIIKSFKPDVIIGFGGYTSYSMLKAGLNLKIPTLLHEQNSVVGKSNLVLAKKVDYLISAYDNIEKQTNTSNVLQLGNPTSYKVSLKEKANLEDYGLSNDKKTILIVMGSQGSQTVDNVMQSYLINKNNPNYQYIYICGEAYYENYKDLSFPDNVKILAYENNLASLIKACDIVVSRAGASALTEIMSANTVSILVPSKYVTNNHQYENARAIIAKNAALVVDEDDQLEANLSKQIDLLLSDEDKFNEIKKNTKEFSFEDSAKKIYELLKKESGEDV